MTRRPPSPPKPLAAPREVRVRPHTYQPSEAELNDPIAIRKPDGTAPTPDELATAVLRPVRIVEDPAA